MKAGSGRFGVAGGCEIERGRRVWNFGIFESDDVFCAGVDLKDYEIP